MKISDIQNVLILARQGIKVVADSVDAKQGAQGFASISAVEEWATRLVQQNAPSGDENADENGQSVEVVEVEDIEPEAEA